MSTEANKILVRRLIEEVWNTSNYDPLDALAAPAFAESTKRLNQMTRTALPACHDTIDDMIAEGDKVVVRWTARGTHLGECPVSWGRLPRRVSRSLLPPFTSFASPTAKLSNAGRKWTRSVSCNKLMRYLHGSR